MSQGNEGNEHGCKKWQGGKGPHGTNLARSETREGREMHEVTRRVTRELTGGT